ncbi:uncharacterized protein ColSpa_01334 [Colletotrichum spaethianum]|uniref:Uncharacterized protein n=1 Tax=Colletotrichum spaethianum TaxID=700344 RepID=A0AA37NYH0_9PEZI|nr:uncharacterized protein ColSpa_01334 [Colletotrichum spaethianum]GKT41153.1 hypothetical protein ColSpa_01334 [Colletotrichum spaethianum]
MRRYLECASSIYESVAFTITDISLARNLFGDRHRGSIGHPFQRINLSFWRQAGEGSNFEQWVNLWSTILRLLDTPYLAAVNLWLDSDIYYERHWLSVTTNVLRRMPEALTHKAAVNLPPDGHRDRAVATAWLRGLDEMPWAESTRKAKGTFAEQEAEEARCFEVRRMRA